MSTKEIKKNKYLLKVIDISARERYCYSLKAARDEFPLSFEDLIQDKRIETPLSGEKNLINDIKCIKKRGRKHKNDIKATQKLNKVEDLEVESTKNLIPNTKSEVILGIDDTLNDVNSTGGYRHKVKKRCENNETNKKVSAKKAKVKLKYLQSIELVEELKFKKIPSIIEKAIKSNRLSIQSYNQYEQQECFNFLNGSSKEKIALNLLLTASNADELKFIKEVILTPQYAKLLFNELNLNNLVN